MGPRLTPLCLAPVLGLAVGGCSFDGNLPAARSIACSASGACPAGYQCANSLGLCIPTSNTDHLAPVLVNPTVTPAQGTRGTRFTAGFASSKPLGLPPRVLFVASGSARAMGLEDAGSGPSPVFQFGYTAVGDEGSGQATVLVDLVDTLGNAASNLVAGSVALEFSGPSLISEAFVVPDQPGTATKQVRPGAGLSVRIETSEDVISEGLALELEPEGCGDAGAVALALAANAGGIVDFGGAAPAAACTYALCLSGLQDLAGNLAQMGIAGATPAAALACTGRGLALPDQLEVVAAGPVVAIHRVFRTASDGGEVAATEFSGVAGYNRLGLDFGVAPIPAQLQVTLGAQSWPSCGIEGGGCAVVDGGLACLCTYRIDPDAGSPEGGQEITIFAEDLAGNLGQASSIVAFDFTPPAAVAGSASIQYLPQPGNPLAGSNLLALGPSGLARVQFSVTEPLGSLSLAAEPGSSGLSWSAAGEEGLLYAFTASLAALPAVIGCQVVEATAVDLVGNQATFPLFPTPSDAGCLGLDLDTGPPPAPAVGVPDRISYRRAPWGDPQVPNTTPTFQVVGAAASAVPGHWLLVEDASGSEIARAQAASDGSFGPVGLGVVDRPTVSLSEVDPAGNASAPVGVRDVQWVAIPGAPVGSAPHQVSARAVHVPWLLATEEVVLPGGPAPVHSRGEAVWRLPIDTVGEYDSYTSQLAYTSPATWDSAHGEIFETAGAGFVQVFRADNWTFPPVTDPEDDGNPGAPFGGLAWDSRRGVAVFVPWQGADPGLSDPSVAAWEWTGYSWRAAAASADPGPEACCGFPASYDSWRALTLAFGGLAADGGGLSNALWGWDGLAWNPLIPDGGSAPDARYGAAMAFDSLRGVTVLFGGAQGRQDAPGGATSLSDTWEFDGASWRPVPAGDGGSPRGGLGYAARFDPASGATLLWGPDGLWSSQGAGWSARPLPQGFPVVPANAGLVAVPDGGAPVVLRGCGLAGSTPALPGELDAFAIPEPDTGQLSLQLILQDSTASVWYPAAWIGRAGTWSLQGTGPYLYADNCWSGAAAAADNAGNIILQGGICGSGLSSPNTQTFFSDGTSWPPLTNSDPPEMAAIGASIIWDGTAFVRMGGIDQTGSPTAEVWLFQDGGWIDGAPLPAAADGGGIAPRAIPFLRTTGSTLVMGGGCTQDWAIGGFSNGSMVCLADLWALAPDAGVWSALPSVPFAWDPSTEAAQLLSALQADPLSGEVFYFAYPQSAPYSVYLLGDGGWQALAPTPLYPSGGSAIDPLRQTLIASDGYGNFWEWDGAAWTQLEVSDAYQTGLPARMQVGMVEGVSPLVGTLSGRERVLTVLADPLSYRFSQAELETATAAPSVVFEASTVGEGIPLQSVTRFQASGAIGGDSQVAAGDGGWSPVSGAALQVWLNGGWRALDAGASSAPSSSPGAVALSISDPATLQNLSADLQQFNVAAVPAGTNGKSWAEIQASNLVIEIDYRLDP